MHLDIHTLFIVHSLVSLVLAMLLVVFWRAHRNIPGVREWALGTVLFALSVVSLTLHDTMSANFSVVLANTLGLLGMAALWNGVRLFRGRHTRWVNALVVTLAVAVFVFYCTYVAEDVPVRIAVVSVVVSLACGLCAWEIAYKPLRPLRGSALLAVVLFAILAAALAARAVTTLLWPPTSDIFAPNAALSANLLFSLVGHITATIVVLIMAVEHLKGEIEERNADLNSARIAAEEASRAKSEFLAIMSHELRTPLNAIIGFSDMQCRELLGPLGNARYREYARDIHASGKHLLDVINTILDISKAEAGKLHVQPVDLDPEIVVEAAVRLVRNAAEAKQIRLAFEPPPGPLICRADPQALKQILLNLLSNAVKFTLAGGEVKATLGAPTEGEIEFVVQDTGIGIAEQDLPRLMRPFEQAARGYTRRQGGTGLGLPLVDALVRLHGGTLRIESAPRAGTRISVRLPGSQAPSVAMLATA